jgi:hypothetical protein
MYPVAPVMHQPHFPTHAKKLRLGTVALYWSVLFGASVWARDSWAEKTEAEKASAESLFAEARQLMKAGSFAEACPKLADSQRLDPALGTLLNLALCYEKNGQTARAWLAYRDAAGVAHASGENDRGTLALDAAALLAPLVPKLTVQVEPQDTEIVLVSDDQRLPPAAFGTPVPSDPGEHVITVSAPGRKTYSRRVSLTAGQSLTINIPRLETDANSNRTSARTAIVAEEPQHTQQTFASTSDFARLRKSIQVERTIGWTLEAVGAVGVTAGAVLAIYGKHTYDNGNCDATGLCASLADYQHRRRGLEQVQLATVGFSVGLTALVAGTLLLWTAPRDMPVNTEVAESGLRPAATIDQDRWVLSVQSNW